jgi:hypothetical protein
MTKKIFSEECVWATSCRSQYLTCQESCQYHYCSWGEEEEEEVEPKKKVKRVKSPIPRPKTVAEKKIDKRMKNVLEWPTRRVKSSKTTIAEKTLNARMKNVLRGI